MRDLIKKILRESEEEFDWVPDVEEMSITLKSLFDRDKLEIGDVIIVTGEIRQYGGQNKLYTRLENTPLKLRRKDYDKDGIKRLLFEWLQPKETRPSGWNIVSASGYFETERSTINTTDGNLIISGIIKPSEFIKESEEDDFGWAEEILDRPNMFNTLSKGNDNMLLFYFYPNITGNEYKQYIEPILTLDGISTKYTVKPYEKIDHLEIHPPLRFKDGSGTKLEALHGDVLYFDCETVDCFVKELRGNSSIPHDGRTYFNIP